MRFVPWEIMNVLLGSAWDLLGFRYSCDGVPVVRKADLERSTIPGLTVSQ
jgi:hypothetical protein